MQYVNQDVLIALINMKIVFVSLNGRHDNTYIFPKPCTFCFDDMLFTPGDLAPMIILIFGYNLTLEVSR